ncbi:MAG: broad specificity phosphatase PhoE [Zhongshania sp.]|jgi:broad specificity phosphatase PhoE
MPSTGRICFIRHGQTYANINKVWHGQTDTELTAEGYLQAQKLAAYFANYLMPDVIYTSPLQRARITAEAIGRKFNLPVEQDSRLMEFHLGDWEGIGFVELGATDDIYHQLVHNPDFTPPNGESQNIVKQRMIAAIEEITAKHPEDNVLIVAHGVSIGIALAHYLDGDTCQWPKYNQVNTGVSELCFQSMNLLRFNQSDHLND